jgi:hypothetical protein
MGKMPLAVGMWATQKEPENRTGENRTQENWKSSIQPKTTNSRDKTIVAELKNTRV